MSLINEALKQTRGEASRASPDGPMGMPVTHPRDRERRIFRTDILIVGAVLLLPLLVLGGAALLYLTKTRGSQPQSVSAPVAPVMTPAAVPVPAPVPAVASRELPHPGVSTPRTPAPASAAPKPQEPQVSSTKPTSTPAAPASRAALDKLRASLAVTAIIGTGNTAKALVNSRIVKVGDTIEGAVVVAIGADVVTLELDGEKAELVLK